LAARAWPVLVADAKKTAGGAQLGDNTTTARSSAIAAGGAGTAAGGAATQTGGSVTGGASKAGSALLWNRSASTWNRFDLLGAESPPAGLRRCLANSTRFLRPVAPTRKTRDENI
jgi:hypothetical protein